MTNHEELREKIAAIIDPEIDAHRENMNLAKCRALVSIAEGKADAILALWTEEGGLKSSSVADSGMALHGAPSGSAEVGGEP